jgi:hypothetical protein
MFSQKDSTLYRLEDLRIYMIENDKGELILRAIILQIEDN